MVVIEKWIKADSKNKSRVNTNDGEILDYGSQSQFLDELETQKS